jgi:hypothetical protein
MKTKISLVLLTCLIFVSCEFVEQAKTNLPSAAVASLEKVVSGLLLFQAVSDSALIELGSAYSIDLSGDLRGLREALVKVKASLLALKIAIEQEATPRNITDKQERLDLLKQLERLLPTSGEIPLS